METHATTPINHQITTYKLLRAIGDSLEPEDVAYYAVEKVVELTGWLAVAILTPTAEEMLVVRAAIGSLLTDIGVNGRAFRTGDTQIVDDLVGDSDEGPTYQKIYSALSIPLARGRRRLGVFNIEKDTPFTADDRLLAESMAEVIALALDHAELYAQSQRRLAAQMALQEAAFIISSTLEPPAVLNRIAEQMGRAVSATGVYIYSYHKEPLFPTMLAVYINPKATAEQVSNLGVLHQQPHKLPEDSAALERGELTVRYLDDLDLATYEQAHTAHSGMQTLLTIPLRIGNVTVAYAELWQSQRRLFTDYETTLCQGIAQHAAMAIENARLFQTIEEERGRLRALIESDEDGIILVGTDARILLMNAPGFDFLQLNGCAEAWIGRTVAEAVEIVEAVAAPAAHIIQAEVRRINQGDLTAGEGEIEITSRIIHWRNLPVMAEGTAVGRLIVLRDVTREHALEKMRDDLTHTMVHDLRGPLTAISLSLEALQMLEKSTQDVAGRRVQAVERAYISTQRLLTLVQAILELSRLESGHLPLNYQAVSLNGLLSNIVDMQLPVARDKEIDLVYVVPETLPELSLDRHLIERVLQNLVDNALKFTAPGGRVCIEAQLDARDPYLVWVAVTDTGPGIDPSMQQHLFQKFSRGLQKERGSGLGLYFCKMAVEAHHGRIWLERSDQTGTTIRFTLPVKREA